MKTNVRVKDSDRGRAVQVLMDIFEKAAFTNISLRGSFLNEPNLDQRSRAFVTEMVMTTVRNLIQIDYVIDHFSMLPVERMKPVIRNILRVGICQMRYMDKVPDHAVINEAVELAKAYGFQQLAGFINGVLRSAARETDKPEIHVGDVGLMYSYPKNLLLYLEQQMPGDQLAEFLSVSHCIPHVTVLPNFTRISTSDLVHVLYGEGVESRICFGCEGFLLLKATGDISALDSYRKGLFIVMDPSAFRPVMMLSPKPGETLIDLCAAPGGKSFAAACLMENRGRVLAFDIYPHKLKLIEDGRKRLGLNIVEPKRGSALVYDRGMEGSADCVLLDAPCSGLGTIRRHPEIKYRFCAEAVSKMAQNQKHMLMTAARYLRPGGRLVYSACTISGFENEEIASDSFGGLRLKESIRIMPTKDSDGFFVAKYVL